MKTLSDEDRRMIVRWIDLGCPIDIDPDYDPKNVASHSYGWLGDDQRPTLSLTYPEPGPNKSVSRILVGMTDAFSGIDPVSFTVTADFKVNGVAAGENLTGKFQPLSDSRWELKLQNPLTATKNATLTITVKDRHGNTERIVRKFSVSGK